jgi:hypothetical protein
MKVIWDGHVVFVGEIRRAYKIVVENFKGRL